MVSSKPVFEGFRPPSVGYLKKRLGPLRWYFRPTLLGAENLRPDRPGLLVGNHAIFGIIDSPLFFYEVYSQTGVFPRSLGDHSHFSIPGWGDSLIRFGAVPGTRENCARLMRDGQHILVFPGGAREVAKRKDEVNRLVWKQRTGFARMAISHGYDIIPFASLGCDEAYSILFDGEDFRQSRIGKWLLKNERINDFLRDGDVFMPIARGLGPTSIPRPQPFYFAIGSPIATHDYQGQEDDPEILWKVRNQVAASIEHMIAQLAARREKERTTLPAWRRWLMD